jgi:uncharacterized membrane protein
MLINIFKILASKKNTALVTKRFLKSQHIPFDTDLIDQEILGHANENSLLSIYDCLFEHAMEVEVLQTEAIEDGQMNLPAIAQLKDEHDQPSFCCIEKVKDDHIHFFDIHDKKQKLHLTDVNQVFTGVVLSADATKDTSFKTKAQRSQDRIDWIILLIIGICVVGLFIGFFQTHPLTSLRLFLILKTIGTILSFILLWNEIDQFNPAIQSICSLSGKSGCQHILTSKAARLYDGAVSLSELVFYYFLGGLLVLLSLPSDDMLGVLQISSLCSVPAIIYSLYIQFFVLKDYCPLCLGVIVLLIIELGTLIFHFNMPINLSLHDWIKSALAILLPILFWRSFFPLIQKAKKSSTLENRLNQLKTNETVFQALLQKSQPIKYPIDGIGIELKTNSAQYNIVKVCNPYCRPCAQAHPILHGLFEDGLIHLKIIFNASDDEDDRRLWPVLHFLDIQTQGNMEQLQEALNDWYEVYDYNYEAFAQKYPLSTPIEVLKPQIKAMYQWCQNQNIAFTPTVFINSFELPQAYSIKDLKHILK